MAVVGKRASIRSRIYLACGLPLAGLVVLAGNTLLSGFSAVERSDRLAALIELAPDIGNMVHELQKERGTSAGFLAAKGTGAFVSRLAEQRGETDRQQGALVEKLKRFPAAKYGTDFQAALREAVEGLAGTEQIRDDVSTQRGDPTTVIGRYTTNITRLLGAVSAMSALADDGAIAASVHTYLALLEAKEAAGLERAMGAAGFAAGKFEPAVHKTFLELGGRQQGQLRTYASSATAAQRKLLADALAGAAPAEIEEMRRAAAASAFTGNAGAINGDSWFDAATRRIDALKRVDDRLAADLLTAVRNDGSATRREAIVLVSVLTPLVLLLLWYVSMLVAGIVRPLTMVTKGVKQLAAGDIDLEVPKVDRQDEIGELAQALAVFKDNAVEQRRLTEQQRAAQQEKEARAARIESLVNSFAAESEAIIGTVRSSAQILEGTSTEMASIAEQSARQAQAVAAAAEQSSTNVQTVAAASEELGASIAEIARQIAHSNSLTTSVSQDAQRATELVDRLDRTAGEIGDVVNLINAIAAQTNLLALNATIEAARAGEAGKGFAVVANEVKQLATQTAKATGDIAARVGLVQEATTQAGTAIRGIGGSVQNVAGVISSIASAIEEQGAATQEIVRNVDQAAIGTQEVTVNIVSVSESSQQAGTAAEQVHTASVEMLKQADSITVEVRNFLTAIKAA